MKAILFDMDGTLLDSMERWRSLTFDFIEDLGLEEEDYDSKQIITMGTQQLIGFLNEKFDFSLSEEDADTYVLKKIHDFYGTEVEVLPGVEELLDELEELGIPMAVGTATEEDLAKYALESTGLDHYFEFLHSASTDGDSKDKAQFFIRAAERFDLPGEEIVLFDDALYALKAAKEAGYYVVGMEDLSYQQDRSGMKEVADEYVKTLEDFPVREWLEKLNFEY